MQIKFVQNLEYDRPTLVVISGPPGAGKSTHATNLLPFALGGVTAYDRDKVALSFMDKLLSGGCSTDQAGKLSVASMENDLAKQIGECTRAKKHFVLETPLCHPDYWRYLDHFEKNGYQIELLYLCLDSVNDCLHRVSSRVARGGHYVPPQLIRDIYSTNLTFISTYKSTFKSITFMDGTRIPEPLIKLNDNQLTYAQPKCLEKEWIKTYIPEIRAKALTFLKQPNIKSKKRNKRFKL